MKRCDDCGLPMFISHEWTEQWCQCEETVKARKELGELMHNESFRAVMVIKMAEAEMHVRKLEQNEKVQVQECIKWLQTQPVESEEKYTQALKEAGERWPAVKALIGWE